MAKTPLQHSHHIVPTWTYVKTLIALTVLMLLTIFASYVDFPGGVLTNNLVALTIAVIKSFLVIWVFMGIRWSTSLTKLWAVTGFIVMPMMFIMFQDYFMRYREVVPGWEGKTDTALPRVLNPVSAGKQVAPEEMGLRPRG
jgi:cytochrome c oxidase subunit IV